MAITRLASLEPTTSAASFTTISGAYKALIIMGQTKSDDSSSGTTMSSQIYMQFNSDSGSNYRKNFIYTSGTSYGGTNDGSGTTQTQCYWESANSYSSYLGWGGWHVLIPDYAIAGATKAAQVEFATITTSAIASSKTGVQGWSWSGTDAITTITFTDQHGDFVSGTNIVLYGLEV
jgi:hypothetical protein|tara:strand:- start:439 stop:966 length:528 start_codon:yes stop_codon:yes gene_type:complete